jgi:hypothetical protein
VGSVTLPAAANSITTGGGRVWVATYNQIVEIDPIGPSIVRKFALANQVSAITYYAHRLWAANN